MLYFCVYYIDFNSPKEDFYIVYLFNKDLTKVYLTLGLGSTNKSEKEYFDLYKREYLIDSKTTLKRNIDNYKDELIKLNIDLDEFNDNIDLGRFIKEDPPADIAKQNRKAENYENGSIFVKEYDMSKLPPEEEMIDDFNKFVKLYSFVLDELCDINLKDSKNSTETANESINKSGDDNIYDEKKFLEEVYITKKEYKTLKNLLENKKNIIIQGPPGVGNTFMAKRLAYSIIGSKDDDKVEFVQFHQSYAYEDFVRGYKPINNGFALKDGIFYEFCKKAEKYPENKYFFIIDEINRGKLSKIFGELFMLIENDKRGPKYDTKLLYSDETTERFSIPENLYIIGLMNTADRSIALIDYALRRRFAFFDIKPRFDTEGFKKYREELDNEKFNELVKKVEELNRAIEDDDSLDEGFKIGHSYLCNINKNEVEDKLEYIVNYELIPLINEYWFDEHKKRKYWIEILQDAIGYNEE